MMDSTLAEVRDQGRGVVVTGHVMIEEKRDGGVRVETGEVVQREAAGHAVGVEDDSSPAADLALGDSKASDALTDDPRRGEKGQLEVAAEPDVPDAGRLEAVASADDDGERGAAGAASGSVGGVDDGLDPGIGGHRSHRVQAPLASLRSLGTVAEAIDDDQPLTLGSGESEDPIAVLGLSWHGAGAVSDGHAAPYAERRARTKPTSAALPCTDDADRFVCARVAYDIALAAGFSHAIARQIGVCAAELASNAVRHGGGGTLHLRLLGETDPGIELLCIDRGPGIDDPTEALADGWSAGRQRRPDEPLDGGLGAGLGAIARVMDQLTLERHGGGGAIVVTRRWIHDRRRQ